MTVEEVLGDILLVDGPSNTEATVSDFIVVAGLELDNFFKLNFNCSFGYAAHCG